MNHFVLGIFFMVMLLAASPQTTFAQIDFEFGAIINSGPRSGEIDAGDVDGDGDIDLVIANQGSNSLTIAYNDGNGNFEPFELVLTGGLREPVAVAVGKLDADDREDIVVGSLQNSGDIFSGGNGRIQLVYSDPDRSFLQIALGFTGIPSYVLITDLDNDDDNDIVAGNLGNFGQSGGLIKSDGGIVTYSNLGNRLFTPNQELLVPGSISYIIANDFNQDNRQDILGIDQGYFGFDSNFQQIIVDPKFTIFRGAASGLAEADEKVLTYMPWSLDAADFNGDQLDDVAIAITGEQVLIGDPLPQNASIMIYKNSGSQLAPVQNIALDQGRAFTVLAEDFDLDGDADLLLTWEERIDIGGGVFTQNPFVRRFENQGVNDQGNPIFVEYFQNEKEELALQELPMYAVKGDWDNDGDTDIAVLCTISDDFRPGNALSGLVYIYFNKANDTRVEAWQLF